MTDTIKNTKLRRPITVTDLYRKNFNVLQFTGQWFSLMGNPEVKGSWIIFGDSSNGKTRFVIKLAKYLANFGIVYINSLEEGESESIKQGFKAEQMEDVKDKVYLLDNEPLEVVKQHLRKKRNAPDFVFFDSVQFMRSFTEADYMNLLEEFPTKIFIFTSHVKGKEPKGALAEAIRYRSFVKLFVSVFRVFPKSRYGGGAPFDIWPEKAQAYHLKTE
ncbi:hypothetical protein [uncultured Draconibacterium sp.]|uniref:hypothetical protein n=1 Tax=uncultured Draconibacterium sp. TaxID=1573823 RepID=UPI003216DD25